MLTQLKIQNFKALADVTVPFAPLTILVGPNGAGKTTVLQALEMLGGLVKGSLQDQLEYEHWEYKDLPNLLANSPRFSFTANLELAETPLTWEIELGSRRRPGIAKEIVRSERTEYMNRVGRSMSRWNSVDSDWEHIQQTLTSSWLSAIDPSQDYDTFPELGLICTWARGIEHYIALDPWELRSSSRRTSSGIGASGNNLAGYLRYLRDNRPDSFHQVIDRAKKYYPRLDSIRLRSTGYGWTAIEVTEVWGDASVTFNARQMSDGVLRLLAISALHELTTKPTMLLIDEIENGVHPHLLGGLIELLVSLVKQSDGNLQVVATTHSPIAVNHVGDDGSVVMMLRRANGQAFAQPLRSSRQYSRLQKVMGAGEIWFNLGEDRLAREKR